MQETPQEAARRLLLNTWVRAKGVSAKSQFLVRLKLKEHEISERKKAFGVEYMDLVLQKADAPQLKDCAAAAQADLDQMMDGLTELTSIIKELDDDTQAQLIVDPNAYAE